ncbi:MAG: type II toxin-antitoxin system Phd/YefM family antitoxin [Deltaproteobacteria bacterium]|nr:type II toxin-antitoxin system Phd/YefM family antitoxin [Deltaproteobacteria bacterium]
MSRKSDARAGAGSRLSATEASRSFSRILDSVERGARFLVHRHGRDVCLIAPPSPGARRASECLELLRARSPVTLDDRFGDDLMSVLAGEPVEERPSWDS